MRSLLKFGRVAQVARATALQAVGHRFKSCPAYLLCLSRSEKSLDCEVEKRNKNIMGSWRSWSSAPACHAGGRGFKSRRARFDYAELATRCVLQCCGFFVIGQFTTKFLSKNLTLNTGLQIELDYRGAEPLCSTLNLFAKILKPSARC